MFGSGIKIPKDLLEKAKKYAKLAGYSSVDEFIVDALEKQIAQIEGDGGGASEEEIKQKLKGLGYLG